MPFDFPNHKRLPPSLDRQLVQLYQRLEQVVTVIIGMVVVRFLNQLVDFKSGVDSV